MNNKKTLKLNTLIKQGETRSMETKLKKLLPIAGIVCGLCATLNAADNMQNGSSSMMQQGSDETRFREITPNAGPRVTNGADVFLTADFIYWTARQDGLAYAYTGADTTISSSLASSVPSKGTTYYPPRKFDPGFKVGVGLNLGHDGWDTYLEYTWFHSNHSNTQTSGSAAYQRLIPVFPVAFEGHISSNAFDVELLNYDSMKSSWKLRFNNFDLELGRNFYISQYLTLRPHVGLKGNWYTQNYHVTGTSPFLGDTALNFGYDYGATDYAKGRFKQSWWGVGIRAGMDTAWYFDKNWSIFGDWALSALWGRFNVSRKAQYGGDFGQTTSTVSTVLWNENSFHTVKGVAEFQLGLRFDYWFSDDDYHFGLSAAWEEQLWINQNQIARPGDLGFQGFTLKARFDF